MIDPRSALVMAAPNGARRTKADHPNLPLTPREVAAEARACLEAGAAAIHFHARDDDGAHSLDPAVYAPFLEAVLDAVGDAMVAQITTEAVGRYSPAEMIALVRALKPPAFSVAPRELFRDGADLAETHAAADLLFWAAGAGVGVQHILYDFSDLDRLAALRSRGLIPRGPVSVLFVLGRYAESRQAHPVDLAPFMALQDWRAEAIGPWSVCAFGAAEQACALAALAFGGHARLGFENNERLASGLVADSTAALIRQTCDLLGAVGRRPATVAEARGVLGCGA